ncbi:hypothetical protein [Celerinatantimonas sp. YJH-8]|uniref:hypothetical protein n=1 Tax=Celerinatantimonas sp. YJH-8 TaxID=3228714 RepID=UPI0038C0B411
MPVSPLHELLHSYQAQFGCELSLPEYRCLEMYTARTVRPMGGCEAVGSVGQARLDPQLLRYLNGPWAALQLLEAALTLEATGPFEGRCSWDNYLAFPKRNRAEKVIAESYRLLRIIRIALLHPQGIVQGNADEIELTCHANAYPVMIKITPVGLNLLQSLVNFYLQEYHHERFGRAYLDAMLVAYFSDVVAELHGFEDEDHVLYQFRPLFYFNRHCRLDCCNPRYFYDESHCVVQLSSHYCDAQHYPIDFHICRNEHTYLIPIESLSPRSDPVVGSLEIARQQMAAWEYFAEGGPADAAQKVIHL